MIPILLLLALAGLMQAARTFTAGVGEGAVELAFGFLLLAAYFGGILVSRIGLPRLTGYLLAGVVAGPFVLDLVTQEMGGSLRIVNGVATCIIGLTAGAELNLGKLRPILRTVHAMMAFAIVGAMFVLGGVLFLIRPLLPLFDDMTQAQSLAVCLLIAVALVAPSPAIVMAVLAETKADGPLSQFVLAVVVVAELVAVLCYAIAAAVAGAVVGAGVDVVDTALSVSWELLGSVVFGAAIGMLIGLFLRFVKEGAAMFALLVCVVVAEIGVRIHLDPLVVMLAAGIWLENFSRADSRDLLHGFEAAQLPVYLVWFALAGTRLDLGQLWLTILPVVILAATRAGWFYLGSRIACATTRASPVVTRYAWVGFVPQAGLSLALVVLVQKTFPSFGPSVAVILLSVLGVNQLVSPVLVRGALVGSGEVGKKATTDFAAGDSGSRATTVGPR